mmetsp:Transcript_14776/g.25141  ORF Transcript_14776/g.25141 Transcript_14776/m.25141 type:complete len:94 (+) Transcript_14776:13-294(+)
MNSSQLSIQGVNNNNNGQSLPSQNAAKNAPVQVYGKGGSQDVRSNLKKSLRQQKSKEEREEIFNSSSNALPMIGAPLPQLPIQTSSFAGGNQG